MDWLDACPNDFRDRLVKMLDFPPGTPGSEAIYDIIMGDEFSDIYLDFDKVDPSFNDLKREARKKYAAAWGKYAEAITARKILEQGLPLREWNWSPSGTSGKSGRGRGEIDLITQKGNRIIFIEVKARCGRYSDPLEAIDNKKIRRLCHGADVYLKMQRESYEFQFDLALITGNYLDYTFEYIEDAFFPPLSNYR